MTKEELNLILEIGPEALVQEFGDLKPEQIVFKKNLPLRASLLADFMKAHRRAKSKLGSWYSAKLLLMPLWLQQASSKVTACFKAGLFSGGELTDLSGGLGIDSFAFTQKGMQVTYLEPNEILRQAVIHNHQIWNAESISHKLGTAENYLEKLPQRDHGAFYIDPSRRIKSQRFTPISAYQPDLTQLEPLLISKFTYGWAKISPMVDLTHIKSELPGLSGISLVSYRDELRETLLHLAPHSTANPQIRIHILKKGGRAETLTIPDKAVISNFMSDLPDSFPFLLVPDPAIRKLRMGGYISELLDGNTVSATGELIFLDTFDDRYGRCFEILQVLPFQRRRFKQQMKKLGIQRCTIDARLSGMSSEVLRGVCGMSEGNDAHIVFGRLNEKVFAVVCRGSDK